MFHLISRESIHKRWFSLTSATARLPATVGVLLGGVGFMHLADYLIVPLLPVVLGVERGLPAGQIGIVLSVISLLFLTGSLVGGTLSDRIGRRTVMCAGALLRATGVLGLAFLTGLAPLAGAAAVAGLGTGLFAPALKAAIAALASGEHRTTAFSWRGIAANIGVCIAGLLALMLGTVGTTLIFTAAAAIHLLLSVATWLFIPPGCEGEVGGEDCPTLDLGAIGQALRSGPFLTISAVTFLMWALFSQLALAMPMRATDVLPNATTVGLIWTINSGIVITLQTTVTRVVIRRLHPLTTLAVGTLLLGAGLTAIAPARSFLDLAGAAALFVCGEMLILPTYDVIISRLAPPDRVGAYFGLSNFVSGTGESVGNLLGGQLLQAGGGTALVPLAYGSVSGAVAVAMTLVRRLTSLRGVLRKGESADRRTADVVQLEWTPTSYGNDPKNKLK